MLFLQKPQPVEMDFVPKVRAEERGTKVFQIASKAGSPPSNMTIIYLELIFHRTFSSPLKEDMSNFNLFCLLGEKDLQSITQ